MRRLLIVGASVRAASQSARKAGYDVVAADLFADRDTREAAGDCILVERYPQDLVTIRNDYPLVPLIYTGAMENYPSVLRQFCADGRTLGNSADSVFRVSDPMDLQSAFRRAGLPFPLTRLEPPENGTRTQWLAKPLRRSGGGQRIVRWNENGPSSHEQFFQQYIDGGTASAAYISNGRGSQLVGVADMLVGETWLGCSNFVYCGSIRRDVGEQEHSQWDRLGQIVAREFGLIGAFGIDGIVSGNEVWPIEVNPRYTASMELHELADGISIIDEHVRACENQNFTSSAVNYQEHCVGKAILYADTDLEMPSGVTSNDRLVRLADLPSPAERFREGQPLLTLIATAADGNAVRLRLKKAAESVRQQFISIHAGCEAPGGGV